jgi:hypothetical protein
MAIVWCVLRIQKDIMRRGASNRVVRGSLDAKSWLASMQVQDDFSGFGNSRQHRELGGDSYHANVWIPERRKIKFKSKYGSGVRLEK